MCCLLAPPLLREDSGICGILREPNVDESLHTTYHNVVFKPRIIPHPKSHVCTSSKSATCRIVSTNIPQLWNIVYSTTVRWYECNYYGTSNDATTWFYWKVLPRTFQPLRQRPLSGARQLCADWLDLRHLAIVLIHPNQQGSSLWAVLLCCKQISVVSNFLANSCSEQIWFLWEFFLYCEQIFFALSN
jgi:hypothetical protein